MICSRLWVHVCFDHLSPDKTTWCWERSSRDRLVFLLTCQVDLLSPPLAHVHMQPPAAVLWQAKEAFTRK